MCNLRRMFKSMVAMQFAFAAAGMSAAWACPMCKEAVGAGSSSGAGGLAAGFYWSIIAFIAAPILLVGGVTFAIVRAARRHGAQPGVGAGASAPQAPSAS